MIKIILNKKILKFSFVLKLWYFYLIIICLLLILSCCCNIIIFLAINRKFNDLNILSEIIFIFINIIFIIFNYRKIKHNNLLNSNYFELFIWFIVILLYIFALIYKINALDKNYNSDNHYLKSLLPYKEWMKKSVKDLIIYTRSIVSSDRKLLINLLFMFIFMIMLIFIQLFLYLKILFFSKQIFYYKNNYIKIDEEYFKNYISKHYAIRIIKWIISRKIYKSSKK